jgi:hypothetical protein
MRGVLALPHLDVEVVHQRPVIAAQVAGLGWIIRF